VYLTTFSELILRLTGKKEQEFCFECWWKWQHSAQCAQTLTDATKAQLLQ